jgi:hypothetical protein
MSTTTAQIPFPELVAVRTELGRRTYGTSHLAALDGAYLKLAFQEALDCGTYLLMHRMKLDFTDGDWTAELVKLNDASEELLDVLAGAIGAEPMAPMLRVARSFAENDGKFGDRYLGRDNLFDAAEEIADIVIFMRLDIERLEHHGEGPDLVHLDVLHLATALGNALTDAVLAESGRQ